MLAQLLQFSFSGLTVGATYALAALGFTLIYNASHVINFAQGEFIMIGGMLAVFLVGLGVPLPFAIVLAVAAAALVGVLMEKLAIEPVGRGDFVFAHDFDLHLAALVHFQRQQLHHRADVARAVAVRDPDRAGIAQEFLDDQGRRAAMDSLGVGDGGLAGLHDGFPDKAAH